MLKKIQEDNATGVCVLPNWQTQALFPEAMKMILQKADPPNLPLIKTHLNDKDLSNCERNHHGLIVC